MAKLTSIKEISQADYNELLQSETKMKEYVGWRAKFSGYPPAGYGFWNPKVFTDGKTYYCSWDHRDNCD